MLVFKLHANFAIRKHSAEILLESQAVLSSTNLLPAAPRETMVPAPKPLMSLGR